jgi:hypothetical protein
MSPESDRFQRWRKIAIDQLGYAVNLILVLTIAALGYWFALLRDEKFCPGFLATYAMLLSLSSLASSVICGSACVLNRLWDFRGTARRAHKDPQAPSRETLRVRGHATWGLFYIQLSTFVMGVMALSVVLLLTYGGKFI